MVDKGGVIAVNGVGCVEKYRFQILLDVADFRGVLFHAVKDKFNVAAVQLHKLCFDKLCRIIVPGDTNCLSFGADSFKDKGHNLVQAFYNVFASTFSGHNPFYIFSEPSCLSRVV